MVRQYVGARYVPKFADPVAWASGTSYEAMTIVTYNNSSYTSKMPVPATVGNPADNPDYWALTGNYNAQVEQYRQETETVSNNLTAEIKNRKNADTTLQGHITTEITTRYNADTTLQGQITTEIKNRETADATLQNNIEAEATARQSADDTLQGNIKSEAATRASADSNLQSQINQIVAPSGEAPSAAEVQNARIGTNGVTYDTLGTAIRSQVSALKDDIAKRIHVYDNSFLDTIYGDANTVPVYSFVYYSYRDGMKNLPPSPYAGLLISLSTFNSLVAETQIYIESITEIVWIRTYVNKKWESWVRVGDLVSGVGYLITEEATEPLNDFNNLKTNKIYGYANQTNLINAPMKDFFGIVCTWGYNNTSTIQIQYAITFISSMVFCRSYASGKWTNWTLLNPENAVFEVGAGKKYTNPISCFKAVKDYAFHKKIVIYEGEYDIYQLMGGHDYFASIDASSAESDVQPWLSDVEIVGKGRVIFKMNIPNDIPHNITWLFSPLNIRGNATIKNITIKGSNIRYCIHDESGANYPNTERLYENVNCEIDTHQAIGCGYSPNTKITMVNCKLYSNGNGAYSYHSKGGITFNAQNCIFSSNPTVPSVRFSEENTGKTDKVILSNCFLEGGSSIEIRGEWDYSPAIGHTDITLINTKAKNIQNGYDSMEASIISYNTITGEKNILVN